MICLSPSLQTWDDDMNAPEALIADMVEWIAREPRPYREVMEAWRTSCPRLPVWEDAIDRHLVTRETQSGEVMVRVTDAGQAFLRACGRVEVA